METDPYPIRNRQRFLAHEYRFSATVIRADTAAKARQVAAKAFRKKAGGKFGMEESMMTSPWLNEDLVVCRRVEESGYPAEGEDQILEPPTEAKDAKA